MTNLTNLPIPVPPAAERDAGAPDAAAVARLPTAALGVPGLDADPAWRLAAARRRCSQGGETVRGSCL